MNLLGFNFTKISAEKDLKFDYSDIKTNIEFTNIEKDEIPFLKDAEAIKVFFKFTVEYNKKIEKEEKKEVQGKLVFEGIVLLSSEKDESKEIIKSWKNKELPQKIKTPLFNLILKKCSIKAVSLEEDLDLPTHFPFPRAQSELKNNKPK